MSTWAALLFIAALNQQAGRFEWPTLGAVLEKHAVPSSEIPDLGRQITSYGVLDTRDWFAIGYYWYGTDLLPDELRIRTLDKQTGEWRYAEFKGPYGSVLEIIRHRARIYVRGHNGPSRSSLLVLTDDLRLVRVLDGWIKLALSDGRIVYHPGMIHFAPVHPGSLAVYDPTSNVDRVLYPARQYDSTTANEYLVDRSIGEVRETNGWIAFEVVEQRFKWADAGRAVPASPQRRLIVTCRLDASFACTESVSGRQADPDRFRNESTAQAKLRRGPDVARRARSRPHGRKSAIVNPINNRRSAIPIGNGQSSIQSAIDDRQSTMV